MNALIKEAKIPWGLLAGGAFAALGAHSGLEDIKRGVREGSVGRTLWGAAQIPLAFAGGSGMGLRIARDLPRMARAGGLASKIPGMSRLVKGMPRTRRFFGMAEGAGKRLGGAMLKPFGYIGGPRAQNWINKSPMLKRMVGTTAAYMGADYALNRGQGANTGMGYNYAGQGPGGLSSRYAGGPYSNQSYRNSAPGVNFMGMPTPGITGQQYESVAPEAQ